MTLAYDVRIVPGRIVLTLYGEVDLSTRDELITRLRRTRSRVIVEVDLRNVTFLDCSAIGALVSARNTAHREGRTVIVSHAQGIVRSSLEAADVLRCLTTLPHRTPRGVLASRL